MKNTALGNPESKARFLHYRGKVVMDPDTKLPMDGDMFTKDHDILRFTNGKLNDRGSASAVSCSDGHQEEWTDGELTRVLTIMEDENGDTYEELWDKGVRIR